MEKVVDRNERWPAIIGNIDAVTWAILSGLMVYPRRGWMLQCSWLRNHRSWDEPRPKLKLGGKFANWMLNGSLEWVPPWCVPQTYRESMGAAPKKGQDKFRAITDARHGNKGLDPWGVRYFTVREFINLLDWNYLMFGTDW